MEAHRTFREEVEGDGVPEEPPRPRAVLHAAKGFEAESAPKFHSGADESQTAGNAEDRRWVSEGGENTSLGVSRPHQVPGCGAATPIDPPTRPVGPHESHLEELPTGRVFTLPAERLAPAFALFCSCRPWRKAGDALAPEEPLETDGSLQALRFAIRVVSA